MLTKKKEIFAFEDIPARPVLSILRDFSAPVTLNAGTQRAGHARAYPLATATSSTVGRRRKPSR